MLLAAGVLATFLAACSLNPGQPVIIDGLSIGGAANCGACTSPDTETDCGACESVATIAARKVEMLWPGHPAITSVTFHSEGAYPGEKNLRTRSLAAVIVVVTFADGPAHALWVACGPGGCF